MTVRSRHLAVHGPTVEASAVAPAPQLVVDSFATSRPAGAVIGTRSDNGATRQGADVEGTLAIDHGALRIRPLLQPGWGRSGVAYGPFERRPGLAFASLVLNGHGASQTTQLEPLRERLGRWSRGTETEPRLERMLRWLTAPQRRHWPRQLRAWLRQVQRRPQSVDINENLAVGWFPRARPADPRKEGWGFIVHSSGPNNADLWTRVGGETRPALHGVQSLPLYFVTVLRAQGAAHYVASLPAAQGPAPYPLMRPVGVNPFDADKQVYAGIYQSVLGQIGFRAETRVGGLRVAAVESLAPWYGTAHAADMLTGDGPLAAAPAEVGGAWSAGVGSLLRTPAGMQAAAAPSVATLDPGASAGLVHLVVEPHPGSQAEVSIVWRRRDDANFWSFALSPSGCRLSVTEAGVEQTLPQGAAWPLLTGTPNSVQLLDDGHSFSLALNGGLVFGGPLVDERLGDATGLGLGIAGEPGTLTLRAFEAHPRAVPLPPELDCGPIWAQAGDRELAADDFAGEAADLAGRVTPSGKLTWERTIGQGIFAVREGAALVQATRERPNPGRTAYTLPWAEPHFADLRMTITPPGVCRGKGDMGRGGTIFWQDAANYITFTVFVDDWYGTSIAAFFRLNGYEELYDAVWSNVGQRIYWGRPYGFRTTFDGNQFCCFVDGEPVLQRALTDVYPEARPLAIRRVGMVVNWEWGNDTGSRFDDFRALC